MTALITTQVRATYVYPNGNPVVGAKVVANLSKYENDNGLVVPTSITSLTDENGSATLALWPNSRGVGGSTYSIYISKNNKTIWSGTVVVPELDTIVDVHTILQTTATPALDAAQIAVLQAQEYAAQAAASAEAAALSGGGGGTGGGVDIASVKDVSNGIAGLTLFKINLLNALGSIKSFITTLATAPRTYTFPDKDITVAGLSDITGTNSGTNTGDETTTTIKTKLGITTISGDNTGDESSSSIKTKLGITTLSGDNTGDESTASIKSKLGITNLSGSNTGDETTATIKSKLGVTVLSGSNTGDQTLTSLGIPNVEDKSSADIRGELTSGNVTTALGYTPPNQASVDAKMTNPMTTAGDVIIGGTGGVPTRLPVGSNGQVYTVVSGSPAWVAATSGGLISLAATAWVESGGNDGTGTLGNPAKPYATINAALDALPSTGGRINIGVGTFAPVMDDLNGSVLDASSKLKANVWFCGSGMPKFKSDNTALEGGTIIQGPLLAHSTRHGLKFTDLGIDSGSAVCAALYSSAPQDTLDFANVGQIVGLAQCEGIVVHNVRTICYSAAVASHTMLFENLKNPDVRNISGRFGSLGIVIKSDGGTFDGIDSSGHATAALYIKEGNTGSNSAPCKEVNISNVSLSAVTASDTPTGVIMVAAAGQPLKGIQINNLVMRGITSQEFTISAESGTVSDIRISNFRTDAGVPRISYNNSSSIDKASIYLNGQPLDGVVTLTDAATINTDCSKGSGVYKVTLASTGRTLANPTNLVSGQTYVWQIIQDATGSRTITTYGTLFSFSGGTPTQSTTAGAVDLLTAVYDGSKLRSVYTKAFA